MPRFLLIQVLFLFPSFIMVDGGSIPKTYNEILDSLQYPDNLVFDVSQNIRDSWMNQSTKVKHLDMMGNADEMRLSPSVYCGPNSIPFNNSDFNWGDSISSTLIHRLITDQPLHLYFLKNVNKSQTGSVIREGTEPINCQIGDDPKATVILNIRGWASQFTEDRKVRGFISYRLTWVKSAYGGDKVQLGIEFDPMNDIANPRIPESILKLLDVVIVDVHMPPEEFVLSYSVFKRKLEGIIREKCGFIREINPNCTIYAKLDFNQYHQYYPTEVIQFTHELQQKYYFYLLQFSAFWLDEDEDRRVILPTFNFPLGSENGLDGVPWRDLVVVDASPLIAQISSRSYGVGQACSIKALFDQVTSKFKSISFDLSQLDSFRKCLYSTNWSGSECDESEWEENLCNRPAKKMSSLPSPWKPSIILEQTGKYPHFTNSDMDKITQALEYLPISNLTLRVSDARGQNLIQLKPKTGFFPQNLNIACGYDDPTKNQQLSLENPHVWPWTVIQKNYQSPLPTNEDDIKCGPIWNHTKIILWYIYSSKLTPTNVREFTQGLEVVHMSRGTFLQSNPEKTVMLELDSHFLHSLDRYAYCDTEITQGWELVEAAIHFARVHNIPIKVKLIGKKYINGFGWSPLKPVQELYIMTTTFPYFVTRNYPEKFLLGDFHTDPCIAWTSQVPVDVVDVDLGNGGTSLYMTGMNIDPFQSVSKSWLEILFQFALNRFSLVEIIAGATADVEVLIRVLSSPNLVNKLAAQHSKPAYLYVELDYHKLPISGQFLEAFTKVLLKPVGIHFKNWNDPKVTDGNITRHFEILRKNDIRTGLLIEDCVVEAMYAFANINNFSELPNVDYLLCNIKDEVKASNEHISKMGPYLDTTLYIQKYFYRMFPDIYPVMDLLFRLNARPIILSGMEGTGANDDVTSEFLRFYSDVNQYARANKIKFFMLPAFDDVVGSRSGWWRISNFEDLTNTSVFIEREAEFLERGTWRPTMEPVVPVDWIKFVILGMSCIGTILVGIVFCRCWRARRNFIILTREEVELFRRGDNPGALSNDVAINSRKFPEEFEIPLSKFTLLEIIGEGQFGLVYKATISTGMDGGEITVAVKKPHSDCSDDSFKSLLSELKVLGYIGRHKHVLEFIGAYVEEIGKGITYIATSFCENGALQQYLRKLRSNLTDEIDGTVRMRTPEATTQSELNRFSHEIALGMEYISGRRITHGDLSTRNVLLDSDLVCKIGDFGHSRRLYEYQARAGTETPEGTVKVPWRWLAIESLRSFESTSKSDVWSYGVTLWEIFTLGCVPYPDIMSFTDEFIRSLEDGLRLRIPTFASEAMYIICAASILEIHIKINRKSFLRFPKGKIKPSYDYSGFCRYSEMRRCWDISPEQRPNFSELSQFFRIKRDMDYAQIVSA